MSETVDRIKNGILGDIRPRSSSATGTPSSNEDRLEDEKEESMAGGSRHDRTQHSGSRDVTEGVTGGTGTETGGTRNYRTGTGATGGDIGNRPE
jgi:hypothetical protein